MLELMAEGRSNTAIADRLGMTGKTVEGNVRVILSKLGAASTVLSMDR